MGAPFLLATRFCDLIIATCKRCNGSRQALAIPAILSSSKYNITRAGLAITMSRTNLPHGFRLIATIAKSLQKAENINRTLMVSLQRVILYFDDQVGEMC